MRGEKRGIGMPLLYMLTTVRTAKQQVTTLSIFFLGESLGSVSLSLSKAQCPCEEYVRAWTTWKVMLVLGRSNTYSGLLNGGK